MSRPAKRKARAFAGTSPMMALRVVDLPAPLRPIRATISPRATLSDTLNKICASP